MMRRGKEMDNEFDIDSLNNHEYVYADIDGTVDGTDNGMIASGHDCDDDRKRENGEIKDYNDNYNEDDGEGGGSVVGNNNADLVTIASTLIDLSRGKEE
jgi:hypothetical protein